MARQGYTSSNGDHSKTLGPKELADSGNDHAYATTDKLLGGKNVWDGQYSRTPSQTDVLSQEELGRGYGG